MNAVPCAKLWYMQPTHALTTIVRMQQVVMASCTMHPVSREHQLPNNCNMVWAIALGAMKVDSNDDEFMLEEIHQREMLDHDEYFSDTEWDEDDEFGVV